MQGNGMQPEHTMKSVQKETAEANRLLQNVQHLAQVDLLAGAPEVEDVMQAMATLEAEHYARAGGSSAASHYTSAVAFMSKDVKLEAEAAVGDW